MQTVGLSWCGSCAVVVWWNSSVVSLKLRHYQFFSKLAPCVIGLEACGTSHHWGRVLGGLGHEVRLVPAAYVKPFVKRNKNDARDAAAICVAVRRPDMHFVAIKSEEQQASRGLERSRELLVKQRTQLRNSVRSQMAEFGIIAAQGERGFAELTAGLTAGTAELPTPAVMVLRLLVQQIDALSAAIAVLEDRIVAIARANPVMRRLTTIPGVGALTAHAVVSAIGQARQFRSARDFAAWCGLTPRQYGSAGKQRDRGISRQGDKGLRRLFVLGASTLMRHVRTRLDRASAWQRGILARRPVKVAVLAQAAKNARIAWAMLVSGETFRRAASAAA